MNPIFTIEIKYILKISVEENRYHPMFSPLRGNDAHDFGKFVSSIYKYTFKTGKLLIHFVIIYFVHCGFPGGSVVKNLPSSAGDPRDVGQEDHLEEGTATYSSTLSLVGYSP